MKKFRSFLAAGFFLLICASISLTGCKTPQLESGGAYAPVDTNGVATIAPDPVFYQVDAGFYLCYQAVDAAFTFERNNRALLWKLSPSIKHQLDGIRPLAWRAVTEYSAARAAYLGNPTPAGLSGLQAILAKVQQLQAAAAAVLPTTGSSTNSAAAAVFQPLPAK